MGSLRKRILSGPSFGGGLTLSSSIKNARLMRKARRQLYKNMARKTFKSNFW